MVFGEMYDENGKPIVVALRVNSTNRRNHITLDKMSDTAENLLTSTGVDITALITGAGEAMIQRMKQ